MDNEYNYHVPNESEPNHMNFENQEPHEEKQKRKVPKFVSLVGSAVIFGLVACAVFQAGNFAASKVLGSSNKQAKQAATLNNSQLTQTSSKVNSDVSGVAANAMPSVVSITNMSVQQVQNFFGGVSEKENKSSGSGIIIGQNDSELLIVTNNHVVEGSDTLTVSFIDDESVKAQVKGTDATKDLAVVAVKLKDVSSETMDKIAVATLGDSKELQVGEAAIAIGNALGYGQSVTTGIVSAMDRNIEMEGFDCNLIQTDAAINPGNSGGALLNAKGEVIGINTVKVNADAVEGMGYAIPISDVSDIITKLMNQETKEKVSEEEKGYLGIKGVDVTSESAEMYSMPTGVYVSDVIKGGGADKAGLAKGSIITKIDSTSVDSMSSLQAALEYYAAGTKVTLTVQTPSNKGEYKESTVKVTLTKNVQ